MDLEKLLYSDIAFLDYRAIICIKKERRIFMIILVFNWE